MGFGPQWRLWARYFQKLFQRNPIHRMSLFLCNRQLPLLLQRPFQRQILRCHIDGVQASCVIYLHAGRRRAPLRWMNTIRIYSKQITRFPKPMRKRKGEFYRARRSKLEHISCRVRSIGRIQRKQNGRIGRGNSGQIPVGRAIRSGAPLEAIYLAALPGSFRQLISLQLRLS